MSAEIKFEDVVTGDGREGGKRKLWVPAELGYGDRQVGKIPAGSDLYFEIELIEALNRDD